MTPTTRDLPLFFKEINGQLAVIMGVNLDDSLGTGDNDLFEALKSTEQKFQFNARVYDNFLLEGIEINKTDDGFVMHQRKLAKKIKDLSNDCNYSTYRSKSQCFTWLVHRRPDVIAAVNLAAQVTENDFTRKHVLVFNRLFRYIHSSASRGIKQKNLDYDTSSIKEFPDWFLPIPLACPRNEST